MKVIFLQLIFLVFGFTYAKGQLTIALCNGVDSINSTRGYFTSHLDMDSTYDNLNNCTFLIHPFCADSIFLSFTKFLTEFQHDSITVYDGTSINSAVLLSHSGNSIPPNVVATSGAMFITWNTDALNVDSGFSGDWRAVTASQLAPVQCFPYATSPCCGAGINSIDFVPRNITGHNVHLNNYVDSYVDYTCIDSIILFTNTIYDVIIYTGQAFDESLKGWIDFNNDAILDSLSELFIDDWGTYNHTPIISFDSSLIPSSMIGVPLRMRFISDLFMNSIHGPCSNIFAGNILDYGVSFIHPPIQTSAIEPENYYSLGVYPNPFSEDGLVKFSLNENSNISIRIIDLLGKQDYLLIDNEYRPVGQYLIPVHLPAGYYLVEFHINGSVYYKKIISMKRIN